MKVRYVGPHDAVDVAGVVVEQQHEADIPTDVAKSLLGQVDNWRPAEADAYDQMTVEQLKALAAERHIDLSGATKKADILAAITGGDRT